MNTCYATLDGVDIWDELCTDNAHSHKPWEGNSKWSSKMVLVQPTDMGVTIWYRSYSKQLYREYR
ncbi:hypothetical protein NXX78_24390 [Bacteroides fragilis]|nr:hypothetical protein [Bacteroides fragilis]